MLVAPPYTLINLIYTLPHSLWELTALLFNRSMDGVRDYIWGVHSLTERNRWKQLRKRRENSMKRKPKKLDSLGNRNLLQALQVNCHSQGQE